MTKLSLRPIALLTANHCRSFGELGMLAASGRRKDTWEAQKESERMMLEAEAEWAKIEAEKEKRIRTYEVKAEAERTKIETEKLRIEGEQIKQEFELRKLEMEHDLRIREVQVNVEQNGSGEGGVPRTTTWRHNSGFGNLFW